MVANLRSNQLRIHAARHTHIRGAFHNRATVGENGNVELRQSHAERELVHSYRADRPQPHGQTF